MVCFCISYQSIEGVMKDKKRSFEGVVENKKISFDSLMKKNDACCFSTLSLNRYFDGVFPFLFPSVAVVQGICICNSSIRREERWKVDPIQRAKSPRARVIKFYWGQVGYQIQPALTPLLTRQSVL
jgi:hypothetical protein